ncbi:MAG: HisA/HisF-related TIM barrel protein [Thermoanaerobaculia bacterium]
MDLLPALDLRHGRVVRLLRGDDHERVVYAEDALAQLAEFVHAGAVWAHVVDLDAAFGEARQERLLTAVAGLAKSRSGLRLELGGGLRNRTSVEWALDLGYERVVVGSLALSDAEGFADLATAHPGRLVAALDIAGDTVRLSGWREDAREPLSAICRRMARLPLGAVLVTDIERDGMLSGPNLELACRVGAACRCPALLSGGVRELDDLRRAARLGEIGGVVVGTALYQGRFTLEEALVACRGEGRR